MIIWNQPSISLFPVCKKQIYLCRYLNNEVQERWYFLISAIALRPAYGSFVLTAVLVCRSCYFKVGNLLLRFYRRSALAARWRSVFAFGSVFPNFGVSEVRMMTTSIASTRWYPPWVYIWSSGFFFVFLGVCISWTMTAFRCRTVFVFRLQ